MKNNDLVKFLIPLLCIIIVAVIVYMVTTDVDDEVWTSFLQAIGFDVEKDPSQEDIGSSNGADKPAQPPNHIGGADP